MTPPLIKYPLDITGVNVTNLVSNEVQTLVPRPVRAIAPAYGAFFATSVVVTDTANNTPLRNPTETNPQFYMAELSPVGTEMTGQEIDQVIVITDTTVSNNVTITYQALGGPFSVNVQAIVDVVNNLQQNNTQVQWSNILNKPSEFPPADHFHSMDDTYGWEYVTDALERVRQAIMIGDGVQYQAIYKYIDANIATVNGSIAAAAVTTMQEIAASMAAHLAAANPHPQYLLAANANLYPLVRTPTNEGPLNNATGTAITNLTFSGDHYYSLYGITQAGAEFRLSSNAGAAAPYIFDQALGAVNSYTYSGTLTSAATYYWQCRYQDSEGNYSAWSTVTDFTTVAVGIITPQFTAPTNAATGVNPSVQFTATAFATSGTSDTQKSASWEVWSNSTGSGTLIWSSENDMVNLNSITVPGGVLSQSTSYAARVLYTGNALGASNYSVWLNFTTGTDGILTPSITYPAQNATGISLSPTLTGSAFTPFGGSDTQHSSNWEIWTIGSGSTLVWSSEADTTHLTSITVPQNVLTAGVTYQARLQYTGNTFGTSGWSAWDAFTTGNYSVNTPSILSPASNSIVNTQSFTLVGSSFGVTGTTDTQKSASWEIWTDPAAFTTTLPSSTAIGASIAGGIYGGTTTVNGIIYGIIVSPTSTETSSTILTTDSAMGSLGLTSNDAAGNAAIIQTLGSSPALNYAHGLTTGGFTDWTVPAIGHLTTAMANLTNTVFTASTSYISTTSTNNVGGVDEMESMTYSGSAVFVTSTKVNVAGALRAIRLVPMSNNVQTLVWSLENSTTSLSSAVVPAGVLSDNVTYQARLKYTGNTLGDSGWSAWDIIIYQYALYPTTIGQAFGGGFYMGDVIVNNTVYGIIVAPKATGETTLAMMATPTANITAAASYIDSVANNTAWQAAATSQSTTVAAVAWARALTISGYTDWQVPADYIMAQINLQANAATTTLTPYKSGGAEAFTSSNWTSTFTYSVRNYSSTFTPAVAQSGGDPIYTTTTKTVNESAEQWYPTTTASTVPAATCQTGTVGNVTHGYFVGVDPATNEPGTLNSTTWTCTYQTQTITGYTPIVPAQPAYYTTYYVNTTYNAKTMIMVATDSFGEDTSVNTSELVRAVRLIQRPVQSVAAGSTYTFNMPTGLNVDITTAATNAGWNGTQALIVNVNGNIGSNATANPALTIQNTFSGGLTVNIASGVYVAGTGGAGGANQTSGSAGGIGLKVGTVTGTVSINNLGVIQGGGGGGAGGVTTNTNTYGGSGNGGGGAGLIPGIGANGVAFHGISCTASQGTLTTGGAYNTGGGGVVYTTAGGAPGVAAANNSNNTSYAGGAAGAAVTGSSGHVTWIAQGTTHGTVS